MRSLIYKYLLNAHYVPGTVPGAGDVTVNQAMLLTSRSLFSPWGRQTISKYIYNIVSDDDKCYGEKSCEERWMGRSGYEVWAEEASVETFEKR